MKSTPSKYRIFPLPIFLIVFLSGLFISASAVGQEQRRTDVEVENVKFLRSRIRPNTTFRMWFRSHIPEKLHQLEVTLSLLKDGSSVQENSYSPGTVPPGRVIQIEKKLDGKTNFDRYRLHITFQKRNETIEHTYEGSAGESKPVRVDNQNKGKEQKKSEKEQEKNSGDLPKRIKVAPEGTFKNINKVEISHWRFYRLKNRKILVQGGIRNGLEKALTKVTLTVTLSGDKDDETEFEIVKETLIHPEQMAVFEKAVDGPKRLANFSFSYSYSFNPEVTEAKPSTWEEVEKKLSDPTDDGPPKSGNRSGKETKKEEGGVEKKKDGSSKKTGNEQENSGDSSSKQNSENQKSSNEIRVALDGMKIIRGDFVGEGDDRRYTGDVYFLKLDINDKAGEPLKPTGKIRVKVFESDIQRLDESRYIKETSYNMQASRLNKQNARPGLVLYDQKKNQLLVGLFRIGRNPKNLNLDVTLVFTDYGTWRWKDLRQPFMNTPLPPSNK